MSDGERRHSGDGEGHLRSGYNHVELWQLCGIMRDVPSDDGLCYMLHVVLRKEKSQLDGTIYNYEDSHIFLDI